MLDKNLIQKNFYKSLKTYDKNAFIQLYMAQKLVNLIKLKGLKYNKILEIGSYTGLLTKEAIKTFEFDNYLAIDIVNSYDFIKNLSPKIKFLKTDIECFSTDEKYDLIIANASLQWCEDFILTIKKLKTFLNNNGTIAVSTFGIKNLKEIRDVFGLGLNYYSKNDLKKILTNNSEIIEEIKTQEFNSPIDILKHFKKTGVNSIIKNDFKIKEIKEKLNILSEKYNNKLTYNPIFIIDKYL